MINNRLVIIALATALCVGCSKEYSHSRLGSDGPEARQVRSLVSVLRQAGRGDLDETIAGQTRPGLTENELQTLRSGLEKIVGADSVELQKIEKFGGQVYRAVFALDTGGQSESLAMLLAIGEGDKLRWVGKN